jgi:fatty acid synthase
MGVVVSAALATLVCANKNFLWDVPDHWTLEDAATVPLVYATVSYCQMKS